MDRWKVSVQYSSPWAIHRASIPRLNKRAAKPDRSLASMAIFMASPMNGYLYWFDVQSHYCTHCAGFIPSGCFWGLVDSLYRAIIGIDNEIDVESTSSVRNIVEAQSHRGEQSNKKMNYGIQGNVTQINVLSHIPGILYLFGQCFPIP